MTTRTEYFDTKDVLEEKLSKLHKMMKKAKNIVIFTGAGISTSAGIASYKGKYGMKEQKIPMVVMGSKEAEFDDSFPTLAHTLVARLAQSGKVKAVVTSNHDGLHNKAGTPTDKLIDLFGNLFTEQCTGCKKVFNRSVVTPILTRKCEECGKKLLKMGTRFGAAVPEVPLRRSLAAAKKADLALVLGSSMCVGPFCDMPPMAKRMVIVNLQETPYDHAADLNIHATCDDVLLSIARALRVSTAPLVYQTEIKVTAEATEDNKKWRVRVDGALVNEPPSWVEEAAVEVKGRSKMKDLDRLRDKTFESSVPVGTEDSCTLRLKLRGGLELPDVVKEMKLGEDGARFEEVIVLSKTVTYSVEKGRVLPSESSLLSAKPELE